MSKYIRKCVAVLLATVLVFSVQSFAYSSSVSATTGMVTADHVYIRQGPSTSTQWLDRVDYVTVEILGSVNGQDGYVWYHIRYGETVGYIRSDYVAVQQEISADFSQQLAAFPESYRAALTQLHTIYPNWKFQADNISTPFEQVVAAEGKNKYKLVHTTDALSWRAMTPPLYDWATGQWSTTSGNWTGASRETIAYYMDPRNFLDTQNIYMFMRQSYDAANQTEDGVRQVVAGTFLANGYNDPEDTAYGGDYVKVIMEAARRSGVSPYVIAATIVIEQGVNGTSQLISGTTGCYNFFNINASGTDVVGSGLSYASSKKWTTRSASIIGGAIWYGEGYINQGQDTYYYKDFNVVTGNYSHQYAQNVYDAKGSSARIRNVYINNQNAALTFRIPVFANMPSQASPRPVENSKRNNYFFTDIAVAGLDLKFSMFQYEYSIHISGGTTVSVSFPSTAQYVSATSFPLGAGQNRVVLTVRSETGYDNNYVLNVQSDSGGTLTVSTGGGQSVEAGSRGDIDGNGTINTNDVALMRLHFLGIRTLAGEPYTRADLDGNGTLNTNDIALMRLHFLGIKRIG